MDNIEHPMIRDAECVDISSRGDIYLCPVCHEECERVYFKITDRYHIIGCDMCIDYEDSSEYRFEINN